MKRLTLIPALILLIAGCSAPLSGLKLGTSVSTVGANLTSAKQNITLAKPHADTVGQTYLTSAGNNIDAAQQQVPTLEAGAQQLATTQQQLDKERHQFFSDRQRSIAHWVIGGVLGFGLLIGLLYILTGAEVPLTIANVAGVALHTLTLGVGLLFSRARKAVAPPAQPLVVTGVN